MEEKFYYSKEFLERQLIRMVLSVIVAALALTEVLIKEERFWFGLFVVCILVEAYYSVNFLKTRNKPAIVVTDGKIVFKPEAIVRKRRFFNRRPILDLNFGRVISANIYEVKQTYFDIDKKRIRILFRNEDNKESLQDISFGRIDETEKLVDVLKQRIKFV
jgi:hypothetical protein